MIKKPKPRWWDYAVGDQAFYRAIFAIVIPIIVQNSISAFVGLLDNVMVGQLGTEEMSGVAVANQLIFVFNLCVFGGISGASIFCAQFFGAKDYESMRACTRFKLYTGIVLFLLCAAVFTCLGTPLISLFLNEKDSPEMVVRTLAAGEQYLKIMLVGLLPSALSQAYASTLRDAGETRLAMGASLTAVGTNMLLNYALIFGRLGAPAMGVAGAAIATVVARYVELAIILVCVHRNSEKYFYMKGLYRTLRVPAGLAWRITVRGLPLLINETLWSSGLSFLTQLYSVRGLRVVAAVNIASTVHNLFNTAVLSLGLAVAVMVGQALGAGDSERAKKTAWRMMTFSAVTSLVMGMMLMVASPYIPLLYNTTADVRALSVTLIRILALAMPLGAFANCSYYTLRSGGKTFVTFLFDCMPVWALNIPLVYALVYFTNADIVFIYAMGQAVNVIKCIVGIILVKKGIWIHNMTVAPAES